MADGQPQAGDLGQATPGRSHPGPPGPSGSGPASSGRARRDAALAGRLAVAAALLVVVLAGIRAAVPSTTWDTGPLHDHGIPLGAGLEVVLVALLAAVELRRRRSPVTAQPTAGLRGLLRGVLLIGVIAIPVLLAINEVSKVKPRRPRAVHLPPVRLPTRSAAPHQLAGHSGGASAAPVLYALLAIALLAAVVACVIALRRRARAVAWDDGDEMIDEEPEQQLRRAVESGQAALGHIDDARLAIIACYLAMERSLAKAGAVRADAETPDELLDRAAQAGLVAGAEAAELTALFYEARFSSHAMPPAKREAASRALAALAQSIPDEARTPLAETPSGGAPPGEAPSGEAPS